MGVTMNMALGIFGVAAIAVTALVINFNNLSAADEKYRESLSKTIQTQALQAEMFKTLHDISTRGLEGRAAALKQEQNIYEENRKKLQLEGTAMFEAERVNGANIGFAKILWQQSVQDNYRIHLEQIAKINKEYDEKELNKTKKTHKELIKVNQETALIQSQFAGGGQMNLPTLNAPSAPTKTGLNQNETIAFKIKQEADNARVAMLKAKVIMMEAGEQLNEGIRQSLENGLVNSLSGIGKIISETITGNIQDPFAALGQVLLQSIGGVMTQLGTQMIALGVGMLALDLGIKTLNPFVAIAGGVALVAAGAAISAISAAGTKGGTQSAPSTSAPAASSNFNGNGSNYLGGNNSGNIIINGMIKGNDIQLVNGRNDRKFNRSLRFG
jgi:hypothetical protein